MPHSVTILEEDNLCIPGIGKVTGIVSYWPPYYGGIVNPPESSEVNIVVLRDSDNQEIELDLDDDELYSYLLDAVEELLCR
jgi:hypothetical protein